MSLARRILFPDGRIDRDLSQRCGHPAEDASHGARHVHIGPAARKLRGLCVCATAAYGNAASRMSEHVPTAGTDAYGGYADIDALYKEQYLVSDRRKREAMLHQIQQLVHERVRFGPIWEYIWPSGVGPRVEEPALMLINPYPWSAPLEEVRLKKN